MDLPRDLTEKTALDLGCADGYHAFGMARRGAKVTAVDLFTPGFRNVEFLSRVWNIPVKYVQASIYDFRADKPFDMVFALGVLYHLQHPLLGLQCLNQLCGDTLVLETCLAPGKDMTCTFYPGSELNHDPSNWWAPTQRCLLAMIESAGFEVQRTFENAKGRIMAKARKVKDCPPALTAQSVYRACFGSEPV